VTANQEYRQGVGIVLINDKKQVFVGQRCDTSSEAWQFPQGGIDDGEDPQTALWREMEEEIGTTKAKLITELGDWLSYDLPPEIARKIWGGKFRGQKQKWFLLKFTGMDSDIDINTQHPEFVSWRWVEFSEATELVIDFKRALYQEVVERATASLKQR
jgi:putative (di)nucleoside polyphosphate hydrolase